MPGELNILLSSAGPRVDRVHMFRSALAELNLRGRILATDMRSSLSAGCHEADAAFDVPPCSHDEFVPAMLEICRHEKVRVVVPTIDYELPVLAGARDEFAAIDAEVVVSSPEVAQIGRDKRVLHRWLVAEGLPTVRQAEAAEVLENASDWPYPLLVKPPDGCSSQGVAIVRDEEELRHIASRREVLVQSIAPGVEHTVDVFVDRSGKARCAVPRRRIEVRAGEVHKGITVRNGRMETLASNIAEVLPGAYGPLNIQMFWDEATGTASVIEINARLAGGFHLAWAAGANFPRWILEELLDLPLTASTDAWREGVTMLRYLGAVFVG
jgi:carbamoyl-phosphate synthase large subunit